MHFVFLSKTIVCEFTVQINKQTKKCNCAFSAYFLCEMNTNISLPSVWKTGHWKPCVCWWCTRWVQCFIHPYLDLNWISAHREDKKWERKEKKKKRESVEAIKSVENININLPPLDVLQNIRNQLAFFLELNICGESSKIILCFCFFTCFQPRLSSWLKICVCKNWFHFPELSWG